VLRSGLPRGSIARGQQGRGEFDIMAPGDPDARPQEHRVDRMRRRPYPPDGLGIFVPGDSRREIRDKLRLPVGPVVVAQCTEQAATARPRHNRYSHIQIVLHGADRPRAPSLTVHGAGRRRCDGAGKSTDGRNGVIVPRGNAAGRRRLQTA